MDYLEEKTPRGITIKVLTKNWNFLAFNRNGGSIYADEAGLKVLHRVPMVSFVGNNFKVKNITKQEFAFIKILKGRMVLPYIDLNDGNRKYVLIDWPGNIDLVPVRLRAMDTVADLVLDIEGGNKPDYIIVNRTISKNDIIIIKNRFAEANIITPESPAGATPQISEQPDDERRAIDVLRDINLNTMSNNPVFLARVHLREMDISKVNQLILDFDLSALEVEYIANFITTMLKKADTETDIMKNRQKLESILNSLKFYIDLITKKDADIRNAIGALADVNSLASFSTLVAKVKPLYPTREDQLSFTEYENMLWEASDRIQKR
jgi:hypothetical protein